MKYKEIIEKETISGVAEEKTPYYLEGSQDNEIHINNEHDKIFRKMLGVKSEAAKFINKTLNLSGQDVIKEEQLEKYTNRFITTNLYDKESDVIYKIKGRNIFILIEHQTQIDYKMPIRMLEYSLGIIKSAIEYKKTTDRTYTIPSVIPIVLYTGKTKWKANLSISENQEMLNGKSELKCSKYNLVDVNNFAEEELIKEKTYISKIMLIEKHKNTEELIKYLKSIVKEVIEHKKDYNQQAEEVFVIMIKRILMKKIGSERANKIIEKLKGVDEGMLTSLATIEEENKMIFSNGRREGKREGKIEEKIEIAKKLLKKKFTVEEIAEITGLNKKYIK